MRIRGIETACWVVGGDDNVAVLAGWEQLLQVDFRIVRVVDNEQPGQCVLGGRSCRSGPSNPFQTRLDGFEGGGVNDIGIPRPRSGFGSSE